MCACAFAEDNEEELGEGEAHARLAAGTGLPALEAAGTVTGGPLPQLPLPRFAGATRLHGQK